MEATVGHVPDRDIPGAIPFITNLIPDLYPQTGDAKLGRSIGGMLNVNADSSTGKRSGTLWWPVCPTCTGGLM